VLVLSHDVFNERSGTVVAVALTSQAPRAGFPLSLESNAVGLPKRSWLKISQIRTLAVERIGRRLARASEEELARVVEGLNEIIG
jgi:mRNA interferase MazF